MPKPSHTYEGEPHGMYEDRKTRYFKDVAQNVAALVPKAEARAEEYRQMQRR